MVNDLAWISTSAHQPRNCQRVYARMKYGRPAKVTFYALPTPRWEGSSIAYHFRYFAEWAPITADDRASKTSVGGAGDTLSVARSVKSA